jgi:hypothetical protein
MVAMSTFMHSFSAFDTLVKPLMEHQIDHSFIIILLSHVNGYEDSEVFEVIG